MSDSISSQAIRSQAIRALLLGSVLIASACKERPAPPPPETTTEPVPSIWGAGSATASDVTPRAPVTTTASAETASPPPRKDPITLIAAGDACFGRLLGQEILKNPSFNPFTTSAPLLDAADIRFVNLESQLSDQKGETQSPTQKLVFTGPPGGAAALAAGRIDIVSLANNHMWDYGKNAFLETLDHLERAKVRYVGAGRTRERAYAPEILEAGGHRVAFLAFTGIWNQGALSKHPGKDHVAEAKRADITEGVKAARARGDVDFVVVSYHGGEEYKSAPLQLAVDLHRATIDAGADAVIGHHPHVAQGIEIYRGKPIFYSLGNYLMRMHGYHLETEIGLFAKVAFSKDAAPKSWVCPFRISGVVPTPILLATDPRKDIYERVFRQRVRIIQGSIVAPAAIGPTDADGCAAVTSK